MVTDPVADALIRIKNGYMVSKPEVNLRFSKLVLNLCKVLKKGGFIEDLKQSPREIVVKLKYNHRIPALSDVKRVSKPGLRIYRGYKDLPRVLNGIGIALISTSKGIMTDKEARKQGIGGEVMAYIW